MSKKLKIFIVILAAFLLIISPYHFTEAQVPSVPDPINSDGKCFDKIGGTDANPILKEMPCKSSPDKLTPKKDTTFPTENIKKNAEKILDDMARSYEKLAALFNKYVATETVRWISDFFGGLDKKLQNLFR